MTKNRFLPPAGTIFVIACAHKSSGPCPGRKPAARLPSPHAPCSGTSHGPAGAGARRRERITSILDISGAKRDFTHGHDNPGGSLFSVAGRNGTGYCNAPWRESH